MNHDGAKRLLVINEHSFAPTAQPSQERPQTNEGKYFMSDVNVMR